MGERIRYADGQLDDIAAVLCSTHPRAAQYLEQVPVLAVVAAEKLESHLTYGERDAFAALVASEPRLSDVLGRFKLPKQMRGLSADAVRAIDRRIIRELCRLHPSTLAQIMPAPAYQRSWLAGCHLWLQLCKKDQARLTLDWLAKRLSEDQSRVEQADQLLDWIVRGSGRVEQNHSWANAIAGVERWHRSLMDERALRQMLANKLAAARYDSIICKAPLPDIAQVDGYEFVALRTPRALRDEGVSMRHCVGSYDPAST